MDIAEVLARVPGLDINALGSIASIAGLGTSLRQWFLELSNSKKQATIESYLEWLRRQRHEEILDQLAENKKLIEDALSRLRIELERNTISKHGYDDRAHEWSCRDIERAIVNTISSFSVEQGRYNHVTLSLIKRIDEHLGQFVDMGPASQERFEDEYLDQIVSEFGTLRMLGLKEMRDVRQSLNIAYVSLSLQHENRAPEAAESVLSREPMLAIRAPAGAGKTTLLHWIALHCATAASNGGPWSNLIPFFVPLRRLGETGQPDVSEFVHYTLDTSLWATEVPGKWVNDVLRAGRAALLIDGVDELPASLRPELWIWLQGFVDRYPKNRVYLTSRYFPEKEDEAADLLWNPPRVFNVAHLQEMNVHDVSQFIARWHEAVKSHEEDAYTIKELSRAQEDLPKRLKEPRNFGVRELCRNPLLCALMCAIHWREAGYLPERRVDLYNRCCEMLMEERDRHRRLPPPEGPLKYVSLADKQMLLQRLALSMMRNKGESLSAGQQIEISVDAAASWIAPHIRSCHDERARHCKPKELLRYMVERSGVLREPAVGIVDFQHRTFQEYFAACGAGEAYDADYLTQRADNDQWHETIALAAGTSAGGQHFGKVLIEALLERGDRAQDKETSRTCYALAVACLETAKVVASELRKRIARQLKKITPPRNVKEARVFAAAGEDILPHLQRSRFRSVNTITLCAKTIALIGSDKAVGMFRDVKQYGNETRLPVLREMLECPNLHPFDIRAIVAIFADLNGRIPEALAPSLGEMTDISALEQWRNLRHFKITDLPFVHSLEPLGKQTQLEDLIIKAMPAVTDLTPLSNLSRLNTLTIRNCIGVRDVEVVGALTRLRKLAINGCDSIESFMPLAALTQLVSLSLSDSQALRDLSFLPLLSKLRWLYIEECDQIEEVAPLLRCSTLEKIWCDEPLREKLPKEWDAKVRK